MTDALWSQVEHYIVDKLVKEDAARDGCACPVAAS